MKNKISDLRNHMFAALERLGNEEITAEELKVEVSRSKAISDIGKVIVESVKTELLHAKLTGRGKKESEAFLEESIEKPKLERPAAIYSNTTPYGIAKQSIEDSINNNQEKS